MYLVIGIWSGVVGLVLGHVLTILGIARAKQNSSVISRLESNQIASFKYAKLIGTYRY